MHPLMPQSRPVRLILAMMSHTTPPFLHQQKMVCGLLSLSHLVAQVSVLHGAHYFIAPVSSVTQRHELEKCHCWISA